MLQIKTWQTISGTRTCSPIGEITNEQDHKENLGQDGTRELNSAYDETGGAVEQLYNVSDAGLGGLREVRLQPLDDEHDQDFPGKGWSVLESQKDQLEDLLLHGRAEELAAPGSNRGPQVGRQLLRVLVLERLGKI